MTARCKAAACGAVIQWARNVDTGKGMPLDPTPVDDGNVYVWNGDLEAAGVELRAGEWPVRVLGKGQAPPSDVTVLYQAHFRSCVDADAFRRPR